MQYNKLYIVVASSLMIFLCLIYQGSYAYFVATLDDKREEKTPSSMLTTNLQNLVISGDNKGDSLWIPGFSKDFTFQVRNPGSATVCFDLNWEEVSNTFVNKNDLVFSLKASDNTVLAEGVFPTNDGLLKHNIKILPSISETYTLTVLYKDTLENQVADMGKGFTAKIGGNFTTCEK